jgi:hypothetical protein
MLGNGGGAAEGSGGGTGGDDEEAAPRMFSKSPSQRGPEDHVPPKLELPLNRFSARGAFPIFTTQHVHFIRPQLQ